MRSGIVFLVGHAATGPTGLTGQSQAFFNTHALGTSEEVSLDPFIARMEALANYDYVARAVSIAAEEGARTVVEIGCGDGRTLRALHKSDPKLKLVGIDVAREKIVRAAEALQAVNGHDEPGDIALIECQGEALPISSVSADLVLILHVLHHAGDLSLLREAARILRPGGTVFVVDISNRNPLAIFTRALWKYLPREIQRRFDREYTVDDAAPPVRLLSPKILEDAASGLGLQPKLVEDEGLFAFLFVYLLTAISALRTPLALRLLRLLCSIEQWLVRQPLARNLAVGIARTWTLSI